jgi:polyisoprenyl-teichoic acid--peptidoglycan teichoic acid transferase
MGSTDAQETGGRPRSLLRRWARRVAVVAGGIALVLVAAVGVIAALAYWEATHLVEELQAGPKREVVEAARRELDVAPRKPLVEHPPGEASTILVLGSDARYADPDDRRSDTVMLVRVDPADRRIALLSIPRDLLVTIPGHGRNRINVAYERGGVGLLTRTVRETLGVEINHFVEVEFRGFRALVGTLGGVYLPIDQRYFNRNLGTAATNYAEIDLRPGYQRLDGEQALAFVRYRHGDNDLIRAARQQLFVREAARQVLARRYDVLRMRRLLHGFARATTSDIDDVGELWRLLRAVEETPASRIVRLTLPARDVTVNGAFYVQATPAQLTRTVSTWLGRPAPAGRRAADAGSGTARAPAPAGAQQRVAPDGGAARALLARSRWTPPCVPTALPRGFWWPSQGAARAYLLDGHRTFALSATRGSGRSVLWTMTAMPSPPILASPTSTLSRAGREYKLYFENRRLRQVAWEMGDRHVWITNTLRNELPSATMLELADSCR